MQTVLAVDAGTHAVRCLAFDVETGSHRECAVEDFPLTFPEPGWVEIDAEVVAEATVRVVRSALTQARERGETVLALGLANMRESAFAWWRESSRPAYPGIMWMSNQSEPVVRQWRETGLDQLIRDTTGLSNRTFFFGSKLAWLFQRRSELRRAAERGDLAVGTPESWLLWRLTGGKQHRTDSANASRYQLLDLGDREWSPKMCDSLGIPAACLPEVLPSMVEYGHTDPEVCGESVPITGMMADQQASMLGHGCESPGDLKATFGTSGVLTKNCGNDRSLRDGLVTSVAWEDEQGSCTYEIEGSAFHSGYTANWLSERLTTAKQWSDNLDRSRLPARDRVYFVPSFTGLGAPRWPERQGAVIAGLRMDTSNTDIARAAVEAMAFQAHDLYRAMGGTTTATEIAVDGGAAANDYLCQFLADLLCLKVVRPATRELTSVGAAKAALRGLGIQTSRWYGQDRDLATVFEPDATDRYPADGYAEWTELVQATVERL